MALRLNRFSKIFRRKNKGDENKNAKDSSLASPGRRPGNKERATITNRLEGSSRSEGSGSRPKLDTAAEALKSARNAISVSPRQRGSASTVGTPAYRRSGSHQSVPGIQAIDLNDFLSDKPPYKSNSDNSEGHSSPPSSPAAQQYSELVRKGKRWAGTKRRKPSTIEELNSVFRDPENFGRYLGVLGAEEQQEVLFICEVEQLLEKTKQFDQKQIAAHEAKIGQMYLKPNGTGHYQIRSIHRKTRRKLLESIESDTTNFDIWNQAQLEVKRRLCKESVPAFLEFMNREQSAANDEDDYKYVFSIHDVFRNPSCACAFFLYMLKDRRHRLLLFWIDLTKERVGDLRKSLEADPSAAVPLQLCLKLEQIHHKYVHSEHEARILAEGETFQDLLDRRDHHNYFSEEEMKELGREFVGRLGTMFLKMDKIIRRECWPEFCTSELYRGAVDHVCDEEGKETKRISKGMHKKLKEIVAAQEMYVAFCRDSEPTPPPLSENLLEYVCVLVPESSPPSDKGKKKRRTDYAIGDSPPKPPAARFVRRWPLENRPGCPLPPPQHLSGLCFRRGDPVRELMQRLDSLGNDRRLYTKNINTRIHFHSTEGAAKRRRGGASQSSHPPSTTATTTLRSAWGFDGETMRLLAETAATAKRLGRGDEDIIVGGSNEGEGTNKQDPKRTPSSTRRRSLLSLSSNKKKKKKNKKKENHSAAGAYEDDSILVSSSSTPSVMPLVQGMRVYNFVLTVMGGFHLHAACLHVDAARLPPPKRNSEMVHTVKESGESKDDNNAEEKEEDGGGEGRGRSIGNEETAAAVGAELPLKEDIAARKPSSSTPTADKEGGGGGGRKAEAKSSPTSSLVGVFSPPRPPNSPPPLHQRRRHNPNRSPPPANRPLPPTPGAGGGGGGGGGSDNNNNNSRVVNENQRRAYGGGESKNNDAALSKGPTTAPPPPPPPPQSCEFSICVISSQPLGRFLRDALMPLTEAVARARREYEQEQKQQQEDDEGGTSTIITCGGGGGGGGEEEETTKDEEGEEEQKNKNSSNVDPILSKVVRSPEMGQLVALLKRKKGFKIHVESQRDSQEGGESKGEQGETVAKSEVPREQDDRPTNADVKKEEQHELRSDKNYELNHAAVAAGKNTGSAQSSSSSSTTTTTTTTTTTPTTITLKSPCWENGNKGGHQQDQQPTPSSSSSSSSSSSPSPSPSSILRQRLTTYVEAPDHSMGALLHRLHPKRAILATEYLLMERKVVILSHNASTLTAAAAALRSLLFPFAWKYLYVPVLVPSMFQYLDCPTPYIVGVSAAHRATILSIPSVQQEALIIDLENDRVFSAQQQQQQHQAGPLHHLRHESLDAIFPLPIRMYLLETISRLYGRSSRRYPTSLPQSDLLDDNKNLENREKELTALEDSEVALAVELRMSLGKAWAHMLSGYRRFCNLWPEKEDPGVVFDAPTFLNTRPRHNVSFLKAIFKTSAFRDFLETRATAETQDGLRPVKSDLFDVLEEAEAHRLYDSRGEINIDVHVVPRPRFSLMQPDLPWASPDETDQPSLAPQSSSLQRSEDDEDDEDRSEGGGGGGGGGGSDGRDVIGGDMTDSSSAKIGVGGQDDNEDGDGNKKKKKSAKPLAGGMTERASGGKGGGAAEEFFERAMSITDSEDEGVVSPDQRRVMRQLGDYYSTMQRIGEEKGDGIDQTAQGEAENGVKGSGKDDEVQEGMAEIKAQQGSIATTGVIGKVIEREEVNKDSVDTNEVDGEEKGTERAQEAGDDTVVRKQQLKELDLA